jgi:hypothetical protein
MRRHVTLASTIPIVAAATLTNIGKGLVTIALRFAPKAAGPTSSYRAGKPFFRASAIQD